MSDRDERTGRFALRIISSEANGPSGAGDFTPGRRANPRTRKSIEIVTSPAHLEGLRRLRERRLAAPVSAGGAVNAEETNNA